MWRVLASAVSLATKLDLKAFSDYDNARRWLRDGGNAP
jgi:hypothetical protein